MRSDVVLCTFGVHGEGIETELPVSTVQYDSMQS